MTDAPEVKPAEPAAAEKPGTQFGKPVTDLSKFHGKSGKPVPLNADGSITCRNCGLVIQFLPDEFPADELPDGAPRTVNHTGCPKATVDESPAGPDANTGFHETINVIDQAEVAAFYKDKAAFAKARGGK